jgi:hypothetical protein
MRNLLPSLGLALLVAACGGGGTPDPVPCPAVAVVAGLDALEARPAGSAGDAGDLAHTATLDLVAAGCGYDRGAAVVELTVHLNVFAGPARGDSARIDYFVAVLGPDGGLVDKRVLTSEIALLPGRDRAGYEEQLRQVIPGVGPGEARGYRVLVGLQPDRAAVDRLLGGG